jgi:hypothetical protein
MEAIMNVLMLKQSVRKFIKTIYNYFIFYISALAVLVGIFISSFDTIRSIQYSDIDFLDAHIYFIIMVVLFVFLKVFLNKYPIIKIDYATFVFLFNTRKLQKIITFYKIKKLIGNFIVSAILSYFLNGFKFTKEYFIIMIGLISYLFISSMLSWIKFNKNKFKDRFYIFIIWFFVSITLILFGLNFYYVAILFIICTSVFIYTEYKLDINWLKFKDSLEYITKTINASYQKDFYQMTEIIDNKITKVENVKMLNDFKITKQNVIGYKCFIKVYRTHKKGFIVLSCLPILVYLLSNIVKSVFNNMSTDVSGFLPQITPLIICSAIIIMVNFFNEAIEQLISKDKKGFLIPLSKFHLYKSTLIMPGGLSIIIYSFVLSILISTSLWQAFIMILFCFLYYMVVNYNMIFNKKNDFVHLILNLIFVGLLYSLGISF